MEKIDNILTHLSNRIGWLISLCIIVASILNKNYIKKIMLRILTR
jgi:hypothetical protein